MDVCDNCSFSNASRIVTVLALVVAATLAFGDGDRGPLGGTGSASW